jgi:hypothetical protein
LPDTYPDVPPEVEVEGPGLEPKHEREVQGRMKALVRICFVAGLVPIVADHYQRLYRVHSICTVCSFREMTFFLAVLCRRIFHVDTKHEGISLKDHFFKKRTENMYISLQADENLGMVMCFMLASDAKEWLDSRRDELAAQSEEHSEKRKKEQEAVCPCPSPARCGRLLWEAEQQRLTNSWVLIATGYV